MSRFEGLPAVHFKKLEEPRLLSERTVYMTRSKCGSEESALRRRGILPLMRPAAEDMNTPILETECLILRKFTKRDLEALYRILKDEEVNTFLPWHPVKSIEETKQFYEERFASKYRQPQGYAYAICLKEEDLPIGNIKVDMEEHHDFGYGLRKEFWHRGIVTEAGKAVVEQVKKDGLPYITATHDRNNPRSGNVMKRLGMKYCYSYKERWQPKDLLVVFRMYQLNFNGSAVFVYKKYWNDSDEHFVEILGTENS